MEHKWAKLFNIDEKQVLFYNEPVTNSQNKLYDIHQIVDHGGERVDIILRNIPKNQLKKTFDEIDETYAKNAMRVINEIVEDYDKRKVKSK